MKISKDHYSILEKAIKIVESKFPHARKQLKKKGKSDKEYRWMLLWISADNEYLPHNFMSSLYEYLNDTHIDTALRKITKQ